MEFDVTDPVVVDGLGFFDDFIVDGPGLHSDHKVGLWIDGQVPQLIAETLITNSSISVNSTGEDGQWMFNDIDPVRLTPGTYIIGAHDPACSGPDCDRHRMQVASSTIPEIRISQGRSGQGYEAPRSSHDIADGYFGPTFRVMNVVVPSSLNVTRGELTSGSSRDLRYSDDADVSLTRSNFDIQSLAEFELESNSPFQTPARMAVAVEASVFARTAVTQTIELYNFEIGSWEIVGSQLARRFTDSTMTIDLAGDTSRFVQASTMKIKARVRFESSSQRQNFSANVDHFYWNVGN